MSVAVRLTLGPKSLAVERRSTMISPVGTGAVLGAYEVIWVGSKSSTLELRRALDLRCEPRGPPGPRPPGPPRPGPLAGAPGRAPPNPPPAPPGPPPGREPPPTGRPPTLAPGRAPPGRGENAGRPPGPSERPPGRLPGGGGIGRPVEDIGGRPPPGGGGIGRPVADVGGCPPVGRRVGATVVGPSGETVLATGLGAAVRVRMT